MSPITCPKCGSKEDDKAKYCSQCARQLDEAPAEVKPEESGKIIKFLDEEIEGAIKKRKENVEVNSAFNESIDKIKVVMNRNLVILREHLGISIKSDFDAIQTWEHPQLLDEQKRFPPDNKRALVTITKDIFHIPKKNIHPVEIILPTKDTNIISAGSPTSDVFSRNIMGYQKQITDEKDMDKGYLSLRTDAPFAYPYKWMLDKESIMTLKNDQRYLLRKDGDIWNERANWFIQGPEGKHVPLLEDGHLVQDILLVTAVPNYLIDQSEERKIMLNFGGTHGDATRAISNVFMRNEVINHIIGKVNRNKDQGVQILIIIDFKFVNKRDYKIKQVIVKDPVIFGDRFDWEDAYRTIQKYKSGDGNGHRKQ